VTLLANGIASYSTGHGGCNANRDPRAQQITAKGQTTVPKAVRQVLGVSYGGEIAFVVDDRGVSVQGVESEEADPVIAAFLGFLEQDMLRNQHNVVAFPRSLPERMAALTEQIEIDLTHDIDGPVAL
jgi:antitoxin PrlF